MATDIAPVQVQLDTTGRIAQDVHCIHCGYNLRSLLPEQGCPECNQPVAMSLRGDLLRFSSPVWLRRLAGGTTWLIIGSALWLIFQIAVNLWLQLRLGTGAIALSTFILVQHTFFYAPKVAELIGLWMVTWPDPRKLDHPAASDARTLARVLLTVSFILLWIPWGLPGPGGVTSALLRLVPRTIWLLGWICLYIHLARLARRIPARGLVWLTYVAVTAMILDTCLTSGYSLWFAWKMPAIRAGAPLTLMWLRLLVWFLSLTCMILLLAAQILYRIRFRRALRQSQQTAPGSKTAGEALA